MFFYLGMYFAFIVEAYFAGCRILGWRGFFFEPFKNSVPLSSGFHDFQWEIVHIQHIVPLPVKWCFLQAAFSIFLIFVFSSLTLMCLGVFSSALPCSGFANILNLPIHVFYQFGRSFGHCLRKYFFLPHSVSLLMGC